MLRLFCSSLYCFMLQYYKFTLQYAAIFFTVLCSALCFDFLTCTLQQYDFTKNKRAKAVVNILFKKRRFDELLKSLSICK